jgi:hypothetical protein
LRLAAASAITWLHSRAGKSRCNYGGTVFLMDQVLPAEVLEYARKDRMVL